MSNQIYLFCNAGFYSEEISVKLVFSFLFFTKADNKFSIDKIFRLEIINNIDSVF